MTYNINIQSRLDIYTLYISTASAKYKVGDYQC